jgi:hypothetical protein
LERSLPPVPHACLPGSPLQGLIEANCAQYFFEERYEHQEIVGSTHQPSQIGKTTGARGEATREGALLR